MLTALGLFTITPALSEESRTNEMEKQEIFDLFHRGKANTAIARFDALIRTVPSSREKTVLQRGLMEMCAAAFNWRCVLDTIDSILPSVKADQALTPLLADLAVANLKSNIWFGNSNAVEEMLQNGGPFSMVNPTANPHASALLHTALHGYYLEKGDLIKADEALSSAIMGVLLDDPKRFGGWVSSDLIKILGALTAQHDIVGAFSLLERVDRFVNGSLAHDGIDYAEYKMNVAQLFAFTNLFAQTAAMFSEASKLYEMLEIADEVKEYKLASANSLMSAALVLANKIEDAKKVHADHPMQKQKVKILERGEFKNQAEFFYAVSDVFIVAWANERVDLRWMPLFEKRPSWVGGPLELMNMDSYRNFTLGLLRIASNDTTEGRRLVKFAAGQRLDIFETVLKHDLEGFPVPTFVDKIFIMAGAAFALDASTVVDDVDLVF